MKIKKGDVLDIELPTSEGKIFNLKETKKYLYFDFPISEFILSF